eukprot:6488137-Pyramimonas_sp.AAC.1
MASDLGTESLFANARPADIGAAFPYWADFDMCDDDGVAGGYGQESERADGADLGMASDDGAGGIAFDGDPANAEFDMEPDDGTCRLQSDVGMDLGTGMELSDDVGIADEIVAHVPPPPLLPA